MNKVVCKNSYLSLLTIGKVYQVIDCSHISGSGTCYFITCDDDVKRFFPVDGFVSVEEYRNTKIDSIL